MTDNKAIEELVLETNRSVKEIRKYIAKKVHIVDLDNKIWTENGILEYSYTTTRNKGFIRIIFTGGKTYSIRGLKSIREAIIEVVEEAPKKRFPYSKAVKVLKTYAFTTKKIAIKYKRSQLIQICTVALIDQDLDCMWLDDAPCPVYFDDVEYLRFVNQQGLITTKILYQADKRPQK
jgi:hypothetical protein